MLFRIKDFSKQIRHKNVLIHIGKSGGTSLRRAISESSKVRITGIVHVTKPFYIKYQNYYIVARDPISRCISSFNWRYKLVVTDQVQKDRFKGEFDILTKYQTLNNLVEKLYDTSGSLNEEVASEFEKIHHLHERISYYLQDFLKQCDPASIKGVFMQESLNADIKNHLGVLNDNRTKTKLNIRNEGNSLSSLGKKNLVKYLEDDYHCLFRLNQLGHFDNASMLKIFENAFSN